MEKDNILSMPLFDDELTDQDLVNLFMGLVRLVRRQYQTQIDKLKAEISRLTALQTAESN